MRKMRYNYSPYLRLYFIARAGLEKRWDEKHEKISDAGGTGDRTPDRSVIGDTRSPGFVRPGVRVPRLWNELTSRTHHRSEASSPSTPMTATTTQPHDLVASLRRWRERDVTATLPSSCLRHPPMSKTSCLLVPPKIQMAFVSKLTSAVI